MDSLYEVFATHGKGVFSTVLHARDLQASGSSEVAIKVIRAIESMSKAAQTAVSAEKVHDGCLILLAVAGPVPSLVVHWREKPLMSQRFWLSCMHGLCNHGCPVAEDSCGIVFVKFVHH